jgi:hypothetical protein
VLRCKGLCIYSRRQQCDLECLILAVASKGLFGKVHLSCWHAQLDMVCWLAAMFSGVVTTHALQAHVSHVLCAGALGGD